jgi:D-alanine-D-alanine ligase
MGHEDGTHSLWQIPINLLLKDNADDIKDKILHFSKHHIVQEIKKQCDSIYKRFKSSSAIEEPLKLTYQNLKERADVVFIALHGRPGEDGNVQSQLDAVGLPYNGSRPHSAAITINKFDTLQQLKAHGFTTTPQFILSKKEYDLNQEESINLLESKFSYPFLLKPVDDGCSSAVKIIKDRPSLKIYLDGLLRDGATLSSGMRDKLMLSYNEEFPKKEEVLVEKLITQEGAEHFLEITGGMLTHMENNQVRFEVFEPSEALAGGEILSLEEKFLAGEGQNITPARFSKSFASYEVIANQVKEDLKKAAQILNVEGYCRIDAFVRITANKAETIVIEINSLPGMTPATCIFHQCAINGYKPYDFIDKILTFAIQRNEYRK